jgi:hypothetical protein
LKSLQLFIRSLNDTLGSPLTTFLWQAPAGAENESDTAGTKYTIFCPVFRSKSTKPVSFGGEKSGDLRAITAITVRDYGAITVTAEAADRAFDLRGLAKR